MKSPKSQSAMEYIMSYGWAIIVIAVVLVALFQLGIFSTNSFGPTANPGSCQVSRSTASTSFAGQCNNLVPKYVVRLSVPNGYVSIPSSPSFSSLPGGATWSVWFKSTASSIGSGNYLVSQYQNGNADLYVTFLADGRIDYYGGGPSSGCDVFGASGGVTTNKWYQAALTYDASTNTMVGYLNGNYLGFCVSGQDFTGNNGAVNIGYFSGLGRYYPGGIANFQYYNAVLDNASIKAIYQEGIGGAPINLQNLIGWWPLNGDTNDYSGNNKRGSAVGTVAWDVNWGSGYTMPTS